MTTLKPYPAYKDSGIEWLGDVPEHWTRPRLGTIASSLDGKRVPLAAEIRGGMQGSIPYWGANSIIDYVDDWLFDEPLVLLGEDGAPFFDVNRPVAFAIDGRAWVNNHAHVLRPNPRIQHRWLARALNVVDYRAYISGSTRDKLTASAMRSITLPLPPLDERCAIADFLDGMDARITRFIAARRKMIALLEEQKQAIINQAVTRGLDPDVPLKDSGVDWLGEIPAYWEVRRLRSLANFITSGSRDWAKYYADSGAIFLRIGNLSTTSIDLKLANIQYVQPADGAEGERTQVVPDDILLSITAQMGAVGLIPDGLGQAYINQHTALVRLFKLSAVPRFVAYSLLSDTGKQQSYMATNGGTKQGLGLDDVANLFVAFPPTKEQQKIVDQIDRETLRIDALIVRYRREIDLMREYRARLISDVVTGKLDVRRVELPLVEAVVGEEVEAAIEEEGANPVYDDELIESL